VSLFWARRSLRAQRLDASDNNPRWYSLNRACSGLFRLSAIIVGVSIFRQFGMLRNRRPMWSIFGGAHSYFQGLSKPLPCVPGVS
jgi:hypothetical protein